MAAHSADERIDPGLHSNIVAELKLGNVKIHVENTQERPSITPRRQPSRSVPDRPDPRPATPVPPVIIPRRQPIPARTVQSGVPVQPVTVVPLINGGSQTRRDSRRTGPGSIEGRRVPPQGLPAPRSEYDRFKSRCCYCSLLVLLALAFALTGFSVSVFAVKNAEIKRQCNGALTCLLSCNDKLMASYVGGCFAVYCEGGVVCAVFLLLITSLLTRTCYGVKV